MKRLVLALVPHEELEGRDPDTCPAPTEEPGETEIGGLVSIEDVD